ncbi:MAG: DUF262 domain-containing protein [Lentisphaeria bacterium]|nr:DUF262 domain-containing protein [Lentisphaeria bacterium]
MDTQLNSSSVKELCQERFYVSFYQRGYRWRKEQVCQLLDDLLDFHPTEDVPAYFLQVLIRSPFHMENETTTLWSVVDGQQRLTTIGLILDELKSNLHIQMICDRDQENNDKGALDEYFINCAKDAIRCWLLEHNASHSHILNTFKNTLENAFFLLYDLPFIEKKDERVKEENNTFSKVNSGKLPARDSDLVKCVLLTPQKDEPVALTKRRATEWDEMERALQDDDFFAFLTARNSPDQEDRMTRLFLSAGLVPEPDVRKNALFPYLAVLQREMNSSSRDEIWKRIADSFVHFRSWYRDNTAYHAIGWYLHQDSNGIENFKIENAKQSLVKNANTFERAAKDEDLYHNGVMLANSILFLFNCAYAWRTAHMRYDFFRHNQVDSWSLEHMRATNITPQDEETFNSYRPACLEAKREEFNYAKYKEAIKEGKGELFLSEYLGEDEYPAEADNSLGNLAALPQNANSSLNNKLFRDKIGVVMKWSLDPKPDYFVPPATAAVFAKIFPNMDKNKPHLSKNDKEAYLEFISETIKRFREAFDNVY